MSCMDLFSLRDKIALITGGSRGIGEHLSLGLAEAGATMAVTSRNREQSQAIADQIVKLGGQASAFEVDVTSVESINKMVAAVHEHFGRIDILVNNAGLNIAEPALAVTEEHWDRVMDTNLKGTFFCAQAVGRLMVDRGYGRIVNISSQMGSVGWNDRACYCASKGGVNQLTKVLAVEWAEKGVTVNAVAPTFIETRMTGGMLANEQFRKEVLRRIPMGRLGQPGEVLGAVIFLASDAGSLVTGHTLLVDGGWTAW